MTTEIKQPKQPSYKYQALPYGPYIRILRLLPGQADEPIRCSLQIASLDSVAGQYDALSYEWGSSSETQGIEVDGCRLSIRSNLFAFLKLLRDHEETLHLWADAICIDQCAIDEKNHQVQHM